MDYSGFGKNSGPSSSANPNSSQLIFGNVSPPPPQNPSSSIQGLPRPFVQSPASFGGAQKPSGHSGGQYNWQRPSHYSSSSPTSMATPSSVTVKVSRPQQDMSRSLNQPVPMRSNVSAGGFRPPTGGGLPIRQSVPPRTHVPELTFGGNNRTIQGFRPAKQLARPRTNSPEQAYISSQYVDLDRSPPAPAGNFGHAARPRVNSPELASQNNLVNDLDSFPPLSVGVGSRRHVDRPRTNSPELAPRSRQFVDPDNFSNPVGPGPGPRPGAVRHVTPPQRTRTPELTFNSNNPVEGFRSSGGVAPARHVPFPHSVNGQARSLVSYSNLEDIKDQPTVFPSYDAERSQVNNSHSTNQARSPEGSVFGVNSRFPQYNSKMPILTHSPELDTTSSYNVGIHDSHAPRRPLPRSSNSVAEVAATNPTSFPVMKRLRSPPQRNLPSSNKSTTNENFDDIQDDEREMLAKAKRLARFKVELVENVESSNDDAELKVSTNLHKPSIVRTNKIVSEHTTELNEDFSNELEDSRPPGVIIGVCTDMCPASERAERERKGDLDRFERLDGDRNQTSKNLAVKKYTRTAEREANLIRPMATLQKTMEYLLNLLDQPYDEEFLPLYNFLWDRMRAIRMDLRMQHIFNQDAITMLEQMIRLHIIVMHELCEYSKGEGFSEGFDAHLNIEQMNKTSVELFQMYDDHRKKGLLVPTEKEFRGYYALLKLDKHPGYMVEPGELSLDLAKMTPEIRQTNEVLFARDVARACRTGNFIAFFRLARKATYLQACLMHAHFAKLRTQALASLHAGLQNNQGLPIIHIAKWLAMEDEDMESLLEYHGFAIKVFDEPYMVKDGAFLNGDVDYNTRCSKLVDMKKSESIVGDVALSTEVTPPAKVYQNTRRSLVRKITLIKAPKEITVVKKIEKEVKAFPAGNKKRPVHDVSPTEVSGPVYADDEDMADYEAIQSPKDNKVMTLRTETSVPSPQFVDNFSWSFSPPNKVSEDWRPSIGTPSCSFSQRNMHVASEAVPSQFISKPVVQDNLLDPPPNFVPQEPIPQEMITEEDEEPQIFLEENENEDVVADYLDEEIAEAKLKLILRSWKRRASKKRELREQRKFAANAALNSLPLGPLVQLKREKPNLLGEFDVDNALRERFKNHEQSWSRLNVSEEITGALSRKNPGAKCLCWKVIVDSQVNNPEEAETDQMSSWLLSKLMPSNNNDGDDDLLSSSPGLSIWRKWSFGQSYTDRTCCLSVVKEVNFNNPIESVSGASAVLFLIRDAIPWSLQKDKILRLVGSIHAGSSLPLLILGSSFKYEANAVVNELGLLNIDKSRISSFNFISLVESHQMEYSDGFLSDSRLREGLQWLASESPPQLNHRSVKTRELVLTHLSPSLEALEGLRDTELKPNDCVRVFNEALDQSLSKIDSAIKANRNNWPCPEISMLEESSLEHRFVESFVPEIGWSSFDRNGALMSVLQNIKLPIFEDDFSFLSKGSDTREEIEIQRIEFGKSLVKYLNESSHLMGFSLAIKEAGIMLQSSRLELRGSLFYIVPDWATIFRRIFNWRLMSLSSEPFSSAYILESSDANPLSVDDSRLEETRLSSHHLNRLTLDEMIEVSFEPVAFSDNQAFQQVACNARNLMEDDSEVVTTGNGVISEVGKSEKVNKEAERLSELLKKCNILQNMIDDKLSVYF